MNTRQTLDAFDHFLAEIPPDVLAASLAFAAARRRNGEILRDDWLNNGPRSLTRDLPPGWRERVQPLFEERDANEPWPAHVRATFADLARKLGHAV